MTGDEVIRLAHEAGLPVRGYYDENGATPAELERFATLVISDFLERSGQYVTNDASREAVIAAAVAAEREACAADCDAAADRLAACPDSPKNRAAISALRHRAVAIRARGES